MDARTVVVCPPPATDWYAFLSTLGIAEQFCDDAVERWHDAVWAELSDAEAVHLEGVLQPGPEAAQAAADLVEQRTAADRWIWYDQRVLWLLDFWNQLIPDARWVIFVSSPELTLADYLKHTPAQGADRLRPMSAWTALYTAALNFADRHPDRVLLLDWAACLRDPQRFKSLCRDHLDLELSVGETSASAAFDPTAYALARAALAGHPQVIKLADQIASRVGPVAENDVFAFPQAALLDGLQTYVTASPIALNDDVLAQYAPKLRAAVAKHAPSNQPVSSVERLAQMEEAYNEAVALQERLEAARAAEQEENELLYAHMLALSAHAETAPVRTGHASPLPQMAEAFSASGGGGGLEGGSNGAPPWSWTPMLRRMMEHVQCHQRGLSLTATPGPSGTGPTGLPSGWGVENVDVAFLERSGDEGILQVSLTSTANEPTFVVRPGVEIDVPAGGTARLRLKLAVAQASNVAKLYLALRELNEQGQSMYQLIQPVDAHAPADLAIHLTVRETDRVVQPAVLLERITTGPASATLLMADIEFVVLHS